MKIPDGYKIHKSFFYKSDADNLKKSLKDEGMLVRVIKNMRRWSIGHFTHYDVCVMLKRKRKSTINKK
jgi:hypothetical protein